MLPTLTSSHTLLLVVRHAETVRHRSADPPMNGWADVPLSSEGIEQAERIASRLRDEGVRGPVYSSPLSRAIETATPISKALGEPIVPVRSLREIRCGIVDGWPISQVRREFPEWWAENLQQDNPDFRWPGGESYQHFRSRTSAGVRAIIKRHPGERVVLVTHSGVVTQLIGGLCRVNPARWDHYRPDHASLTVIEWYRDDALLHTFNDTSHLQMATE